MLMHRRHTKEEASLYQIGTRPVHTAFGRWSSAKTNIVSQFTETTSSSSSSTSLITIDLSFDPRYHCSCFRTCCEESKVRVKIVGSWSSCCCCCYCYYWSVYAFIIIIIVRTLYEGTLVTSRTTAQREHTPSPPQKICWKCTTAQPALCIFLATLTVAARCYASTTTANATHPLVQFNSSSPTTPPSSSSSAPFLSLSSSTLSSSISPINNLRNYSNIQSSNLLISRLFFAKRYSSSKSDTRLIATNRTTYSKVLLLLLKQNRPLIDKGKLRTKRNLNSESSLANKFSSNQEGAKSVNLPLNSTARIDIDSKIHLTKNSSRKVGTDSRDNSTSDKVVFPVTATTNLRTNQQQQNSLKQQQKTSEEVTQGDSSNSHGGRTERPMPPANRDETSGVINDWSLILVVLAVLTGTALGLVTCLLNHQEVRSVINARRSPAIPPHSSSSSSFINPHLAADSPTTTPMLSVVSASAAAGMGGMDRLRGGRAARELAATRDRQVRLHAVHTDIAINLPPSIAMPDGEELPFTTSRLHIRDAEQESEIYQKCIRPPPNRTVLESECPPPNRSSSAGVLASSSSSSSSSSSNSSSNSDWSAGSAPMVFRCHSMSSSSTSKPTLSSSAASGSTTTASTLVAAGQKTDFLQRTVKIFTGKKTQQPPPPPAPTLPIVIVPPQPPPPSHQQHLASSRTRPILHNNNNNSKPQSDV